MSRLDHLIEELQFVIPFRIRFKDESWEMRLLNIFVFWFCPDFMTHYTTVIGSTIYFPNRSYLEMREERAMQTLAHEVVHMLDAERWSTPLFMAGYLFPQILTLGVFTFPLFGWWSLLFLVFLVPFPAPFRAYFESRAYAMDVLTYPQSQRLMAMRNFAQIFPSWNYYKMLPDAESAESLIWSWVEKAESGEDEMLMRVLLVYEMVQDGESI